jgi:hypothetical protein
MNELERFGGMGQRDWDMLKDWATEKFNGVIATQLWKKVSKHDFEVDVSKLAVLVDILKWNYKARDHRALASINLFSILRAGAG